MGDWLKQQKLQDWVPGMRSIHRIHFVGMGGAGMCGLAEVLLNLGYQISGSDLVENNNVQRLKSLGARFHLGHQASQVVGADVVVVSAAIDDNNPELERAYQSRIPVVARAEMLAEIMRFRYGIAVAGTHGKTTTTSLIATLLAEAGRDPTFVIGGLLNSAGVHARLGTSPFLVAEADESDASFMHLQPQIAVVTNIEADHMETYQGCLQTLRNTFVDFLHNLPFYGLAVLCIDDAEVLAMLPKVNRHYVTYGFDERADVRATSVCQHELSMQFDVWYQQEKMLSQVVLNIPGHHNVLNALAAIAIGIELDLSVQELKKGLSQFQGVARRFQVKGYSQQDCYRDLMLVDDYGHHPSEIEAVLNTLENGWSDRRRVMIFQPHRFSRTIELFEDFVRVLSRLDVLIILDVYAAGEKPIEGANSQALCRSIRMRGHLEPIFVGDHQGVLTLLSSILKPKDLLILQGAGNIGQLADKVAEVIL